MTRLTAEVTGELYGKFGASLDERPMEIRPFAGTEDYVFVSNVLTSEMSRAGVRTLRADPPVGAAAPGGGAANSPAPGRDVERLVLQFQNVAFAISYPDVYRSHLIGGKRVRRVASVRVLATLTDGATGEVLWTGEAERTHADEFDRGDAARVESGSYAFLRPGVPSGGWGKYVEPVFVTGIIVGLIYLFFSNQSDN